MKQQKNLQDSGSFAGLKNWEETLDVLERVLEKKPHDSALVLEKAHLFFRMGFYRECLELCQKREHAEGKRWEFALLEASCENWIQKRENILARITRYVPLSRKDMHRDMSTILSVFCEIKEAISYILNIMEREKDPQLWYLLASLQRAEGKQKDALASLEKALALEREHPPSIELREKIKVEILRAATRAPKATYSDNSVQEARAGVSAEDWLVKGFANIRERNYPEALKSFAEALKAEPNLCICWYYVGRVQHIMGGLDKAKQCYKKFIEGFPQSSGFYREQILMPTLRIGYDSVDDLYFRWIGYLPQDHHSWISYLRFLIETGDSERARLLSSEILENVIIQWYLSPNSSGFYNIKGLLELSLDRTRSASESFLQALKIKGSDNLALLGLGKCYENMGKLDEAQKSYEKASAIKDSRVLGLYQLAGVLVKKKEKNRAVTLIDEAMKSLEGSSLLKNRKAEVLLDTGDVNGFLIYCSQIDRKESPSIPAKLLKSSAYYRAQKFGEAIRDLEEARLREPSHATVLKNLGVLYLKTGMCDRALAILNEVRNIKKFSADMFLVAGISHYFLRGYDNSLEFLQSYMNLNPLDHRLWSFMALDEYFKGNYDIAEACFRKAKDLCGGLFHSWLNLAIFYSERGDGEKSLECLGKLPEGQTHLLLSLCRAKCQRAARDFEGLQKSLEEVFRLDPNNMPALMLKGIAGFEKADYKGSQASFSRILEMDKNSAEAWYSRGFTSIFLNNTQEALDAINRAIALKPEFYEAWLAKAVVFWSLNNLEEAEKALKGAQNLKPDDFTEWLKNAATKNDHRSALTLYEHVQLPFYSPIIFTLEIEDPVSVFHYELLDSLFQRQAP
jgi:tetratricopeptide (TPR) repeat protein